MKIYLSIIISLFIGFYSNSQKSANQEIKPFEKLVLIGNFTAHIINSDNNLAVATSHGDEANIDNLEFSYKNKTLTIKYQGSFVKEIPLQLTLNYNKPIASIEARRGVILTVESAGNFDEPVKYYAENGSKVLINQVYADFVEAHITKGGSIRINGEAKNFQPRINAGGTIASVSLKTKHVIAKVSMGGEIICAPIETLDATIFSGGSINYKGSPKVTESITFGGKIEQL